MIKKAVITGIKAYQKLISPYFIKSCRFEPSCSEYAVQAMGHYGVLKGTIMSVWRVLRCNPFSRGGFDPAVKETVSGKK